VPGYFPKVRGWTYGFWKKSGVTGIIHATVVEADLAEALAFGEEVEAGLEEDPAKTFGPGRVDDGLGFLSGKTGDKAQTQEEEGLCIEGVFDLRSVFVVHPDEIGRALFDCSFAQIRELVAELRSVEKWPTGIDT
jgi:hypothetical protein